MHLDGTTTMLYLESKMFDSIGLKNGIIIIFYSPQLSELQISL